MSTSYINLLNDGGFLESCQSNTFIFTDTKVNDIILYTDTPQQNIVFGTENNTTSSIRVTSNIVHFNHNVYTSNAIGIGYSNFLHLPTFHRVTVVGPSNDILGPNIAYYTADDMIYPVFQQINNRHDDMSINMDVYWTGSNWNSADSNAGFQISKMNGQLLFNSTCNIAQGADIDSNFRVAFMINSNSYLGFGTSNPTNRITISAEDKNILGPHLIVYTDTDSNYPLYQQRNWSHDDISQSYDLYWDSNNWISGDSNANYQMMKKDGRLLFISACNMIPGSIVDNDFRVALMINSNSYIGIGMSNPTHRLTMMAEDKSILGPNIGIYTDADSNYPVYEQRNWSHDDITQSYDLYWNSTNWISGDSNANYQMMKKDGRLLFISACNMIPGSIVDNDFRVALMINSNSYIGIGMSNPTHRLTMMAEDKSVLGPSIAIYTDADSNYPLYEQRNWSHDDITQSYDLYWDSNNWISSDSNANYQMMKKDGRLLFISACNMIPGSIVDDDFRVALMINSNSYIGIGMSNPTHRLTMMAEDKSVLGPSIAIYTDADSNYPLYEQRNWSHNDITQSYDLYWDSNNWISSDSNANYQMMKKDGRLLFISACNMIPGSIVDDDFRVALMINSNSYIGIGMSNPTHRLTMMAEDKSVLGPSIAIYTDADSNYPVYEQRNWSHDDITHSYDLYWDSNNWISSDANANYQMMKKDGRLLFISACNKAPGSIVDNDFRVAMMINSNSYIGIGMSNPTHRLTISAEDKSVLGPSIAVYTDADSNYPIYEQRNWSHDDIALSFDAFWDSNNWISTASNGNFQIYKQHGRLIFYSACNVAISSNLDSEWYPALTIASNSYIGVGLSNPTHRFNIAGPSNSIFGPHMAFNTLSDSNNPLFQLRNWNHDDITQSMDLYWNGTNWISSDSNGNFQMMKKDGRLLFISACNIAPGSIVDNDFRVALMINSNSYVGIGDSNPQRRFSISAEDSSIAGPHMFFTTSADLSNPTLEIRNWTHDDVSISFDAYRNSTNWVSSSSTGNFQIYKQNGRLIFYSSCNVSATSNLDNDRYPAMTISSNSFIGIGMSNPTHRLTVTGPSNDIFGPHMAFYTNDDSNYPTFQLFNNKHDLISLNFDSYWNGTNWVSSDSNGNFQIIKRDGKLLIQSAIFQYPSSNLDSSWFNTFTINSNNYIGLRTSNPEYPVDIHGDAIFRSNVYFLSNVVPRSNILYDLGTSNLRWRDLYLSGASVDMDNLQLKKESVSGGLLVYNKDFLSPSRIWVKEILVGDPADLNNSNVYLLVASNNGLQIQNVTSNNPAQDFSQLNNLYSTSTKVGIGLSNPEKVLHVVGDVEINPFTTRILTWDNIVLRNDIDDFKGRSDERIISSWNLLSSVGTPLYRSKNGYYDGNYVECLQGSNYFTLSNSLSLNIFDNDGFTMFGMVRFTKESQSNENIFSFSNNNNYIALQRYNNTKSIAFYTDELSNVPCLSPSNIIEQYQWNLFTIRYDGNSNSIQMYRNIDYSEVDLEVVHNPIATVTLGASLANKEFNALTNMQVGNANIDISHLYMFDRRLTGDELLDLQRIIIYNTNSAFRINTKLSSYPAYDFYTDLTGWTVDGSRNGGQIYRKTYDHMLTGNGIYKIWANTEKTTNKIYTIFNTDATDYWETEFSNYINTNDAVVPAIFYIQFPLQIVVQSYIIVNATSTLQSPNKWKLFGSLDNQNWFIIDSRNSEIDWTTSETRVYHTNTITPSKFIKVEFYRNNASSGDSISIETFQIFGNESTFQVDGTGIGINTTLLKEKLTVEGNASISGSNIVGTSINTNKLVTFGYPSGKLGSNVVNLEDGLYTVNSSSSNASSPYMAFDNDFTTLWASASNLYNSSGSYTGAISTTVSGSPITGEWLEIKLPQTIRLNSYRITPENQINAPATFSVAGSLDGSVWNLIDSQQKTWSATPELSNFTVSSFSNQTFYNYYRVIVNKISSGATSSSKVGLYDLKLYGENNNKIIVDVGANIIKGKSYVSDGVNIGTQSLIDESRVFLLNPKDLSQNYIDGANVVNWDKFSQSDFSLQPLYYSRGGHKNNEYVRFQALSNPTQLNGGSGDLLINANDGLTIVSLVKFRGLNTNESIVSFNSGMINVGRYNGTQEFSFNLFNSDLSASNVLQSGISSIVQNEWAVFGVRYTNSLKKMEIFKNNNLVNSGLGTISLSNYTYNTVSVGSADIDLGGLYIWDKALDSSNLIQISDILLQGYPKLYVDGDSRISKSIGNLSVKTATTFTNNSNSYPSTSLYENKQTVINQVYGNGNYQVKVSNYYQSNSIYDGYNAFQTGTTTGWYGELNAYNTSTGLYQSSASTTVGAISYQGDWLQIEVPDLLLVKSYVIQPRADYITTAPVSWYFVGSDNGRDWTIIDTQTNYTFSGIGSIIFDTSLNTVGYKFYRLVITNMVSTGGAVGLLKFSLNARSKDTFSVQEDKVIIYDKLGVQTTNPQYTVDINGSVNAMGYCNLLVNSYSNSSIHNAPTALALSNVYAFASASGASLGFQADFASNTAVASSNRVFNTFNYSNNTVYTYSNVGIGISNASSALHVVGDPIFANTPSTRVYINRAGVGDLASIIYSRGGGVVANGEAEIGFVNSNLVFNVNSSLGTYTTRMVINSSNGFVGIGTSNPSAPLHIFGASNGSNSIFISAPVSAVGQIAQIALGIPTGQSALVQSITRNFNVTDFQLITTGSNNVNQTSLYVSALSNFVGLGTSNPQYNLEVNGTIGVTSGNMQLFSSNGNSIIFNNGSTQRAFLNNQGFYPATDNTLPLGFSGTAQRWSTIFTINASISSNSYVGSLLAVGTAYSNVTTGPTNGLIVQGNVGIGLSNPSTKIHVYGTGQTASNPSTSTGLEGTLYLQDSGTTVGNGGMIMFGANQGAYAAIKGGITSVAGNTMGDIFIATRNATSDSTLTSRLYITGEGKVGIGSTTPGSLLSVAGNQSIGASYSNVTTGPTNGLIIQGNVGIGKSNPAYPLDVTGDLNFTGILRQNGTAYIGSQWSNSGTSVFIIGSNIGIGLSNPEYTLHVAPPNTSATSNVFLAIENPKSNNTVDDGYGSFVRFTRRNNQGVLIDMGMMGSVGDGGGGNYNSSLVFHPSSDVGIGNEAMRIKTNGNIGVGTSRPGSLLSVAGNQSIGASYSNVTTGPTNGLIIQGNVGIGKSNPAYPLDVTGDLNFTGILRQNGTAYIGSQWSNSGTNVFIIGSNIGLNTSNPGSLLSVAGRQSIGASYSNVTTGPTNGLIVQGNVGIGKSNPAYPLDVTGDINFTGIFRQNGTPYVGSQWSNSGSNVFISGSNIGIGTTTPLYQLHVNGTQYISSNLTIGSSTTTTMIPVSALAVSNPSMAFGGVNYTFRSRNNFGHWNGNWFYDFNYDSSLTLDGYSVGTYVSGITTGSIGGPYSGINGDIPSIVTGYRFASSNVSVASFPSRIVLLGSADETNWTIINDYTVPSTSTYTTNPIDTNVFGIDRIVNNTTAYRFYRVVFNSLFSGSSFIIQEFRWYVSQTVPSQMILHSMSNNLGIIGPGTLSIYEFPPVAFGSSNSLLTSGNTSYLQDGLYSVTTSRDNAPFLARLTFDNVTNNEASRWEPNNGGYGGGSGIWNNTLPAITTTVSSIATAGHWIQLTLPNSIVLRHIQITSSGDIRSPRNMVIAGSSDNGTTWTNLGTFSDIPNAAAGVTQQLTTTSVSQFNNYRFIVTRTWNSGNVAIRELSLFGNDGFRLGVNGSIQSRGKISAASNFVTHTNGEIERGFLKTIDLTSLITDTYLTFVGQNQNTEKKGAYLRFDQRDGTAYNAVGGDSIFNWAILQSNIGSETFVAGLDSLGHFSVNGTVSARGGTMLIGSSNAEARLEFNIPFVSSGNTVTAKIYANPGDKSLYVQNNTGVNFSGMFLNQNGNTWSSFSDERLKKNIVSLPPMIDKVMKLNPVMYQYKTDTIEDNIRIGLLAQNVKKVFESTDIKLTSSAAPMPELKDPMALTYMDFIPILLQCVKELKESVNTLTARLNAANIA